MNKKELTIFTVLSLLSAVVQAEVECNDPVDKWQPQQQLRQRLEQRGWKVKRIRVDDHCYEVKAIDNNGHRVRGRFGPAELNILELDINIVGRQEIENFLEEHGGAKSLPTINQKSSKEIIK